jgi:thioesterase domain-containing protein
LYCVHPSSGSGFVYVGLARMLQPDRPVWALEAPGYDDGRRPIASIPELAARYVAVLRARPGPYALLGWSMGGVIAFEMARLLHTAGADVSALILVDAAVPRVLPDIDEADVVRHFLRDLTGGQLPPDLTAEIGGGVPVGDVAADAVAADAFDRIHQAGVLPDEFDPEFLFLRYEVFRAHALAMHKHEPSGPYPGPTILVSAAGTDPRDLDWTPWIDRLDRYTVPAGHHDLLHGDNLAHIADIVRHGTAGPALDAIR